MSSPLADQLQAAEAELGMLATAIRPRAEAITVQVTAVSLAADVALLDQADRCPHLVEAPIQPAMVLIGHGYSVADCFDCFGARRGRIRQCTACGEPRPLRTVLIEVGHRAAVLLLCAGCLAGAMAAVGGTT